MGGPVRPIDLRGVRAQYAGVVTSPRGSILALGAATETGGRLELRRAPHDTRDADELRVDIEVCDAVRITVTEHDGSRRTAGVWSMVCTLDYFDPDDVMVYVTEWARARIVRARATGFSQSNIELQPLRDLIAEVATATLDRCDQASLALALAFHPRHRLAIYTRLVADRSGRLAELATSCPGTLVFAMGLIERENSHGTGAAGERLLTDVIAGRKLNPALDDALDAWLAAVPAYLASWPTPKRRRRRVIDVADRTRKALAESCPTHVWSSLIVAGAKESLRAKQRLLIRRASAEVPARWLWLPPPLVLIPEDIPRDERDNARWFSVMTHNAFTLRRHPDIDPRWQDGICRFLSRHAPALGRSTETAHPLPVSAVLDYAHAERRWLDRDSDPVRVRADWERWYRANRQDDDLMLLAARLAQRRIAQNQALPAPLFDARLACTSGLELSPIASVAEMFAEAREMEHCVAHHVFAALAGKALVFRGIACGERVTVELARTSSRPEALWTLRELRCARNQAPGPAASAAIRAWAAKVIAWQDTAERVANSQPSLEPVSDEIPF